MSSPDPSSPSPFRLAQRAARMNPSIIREILKLTERPDVISLAGGLPSPDAFPVEALREASARVLRAPSTQKIVVGQIHGFDARPLIKLQWEKGKLKSLIKRHPKGSNKDISHVFATPVGNDLFSYVIEVQDGVLTVEVNGERIQHDFYKEDAAWRDVPFYFKAGAYVQDDDEDGDDDVGEVQFTQLNVRHD